MTSLTPAQVQTYRNAGFSTRQIQVLSSVGGTSLVPGTTPGTYCAGDDSRVIGAVQGDGSQMDVGPWIFNPRHYGAVGDGQIVSDGSMLSGSNVLNSASNLFGSTNAIIGAKVLVSHAGNAGVKTLITSVTGWNNHGQIVLADANASGGNVTSCVVMWGTDDTAAFQACVNAAVAFARVFSGAARVFIPLGQRKFYVIAGALVTGGSTLGNAQITFPIIPTTENKVCLTIEGINNASATQHWEQLVPQLSGSTLISFGAHANPSVQNTNTNANGNACMFGGPTFTNGYGVAPGLFSNMSVTFKNVSLLNTYTHDGISYGAIDCYGVGNLNLIDMAAGTTGTVAGGDFISGSIFGSGAVVGILMPAPGNNDNCYVSNVTIHGGYTYAILFGEHTVADRVCILYCWAALCIVGTYAGSVGATHGFYFAQTSVEACTKLMDFMGQGSGGIGPFIYVGQLDTETSTPSFTGTGLTTALGHVTLTGLYVWANLDAVGVNFKIINGQASPTP